MALNEADLKKKMEWAAFSTEQLVCSDCRHFKKIVLGEGEGGEVPDPSFP